MTSPATSGVTEFSNSLKAAEFWGVSIPHWRRLYKRHADLAPVRVGERKYGWRVGQLIDAQEKRLAGDLHGGAR